MIANKRADAKAKEELEAMKERIGWTPLHVAAEGREYGNVERLTTLPIDA